MWWFSRKHNVPKPVGEVSAPRVTLEHLSISRDDKEKMDLWGDVRLGWAMPNYGPIFSSVYASHLSAAATASRYMTIHRLGKMPMIGATDRMYIHMACNYIVKEARAAGLTHIFWTESDMLLPHDIIPKLMKLGKPIVSAIYFLRGGGGQPCLYKKVPLESKENPYLHTPIRVYDERGPFKVDCPGMGAVLTDMKVFDDIQEPWFDLKASMKGKMDGYGQDLYFFTKVRWAGYEVWVQPDVICDQIDTRIVGYADYRKHMLEQHKNRDGFIAMDAHAIDSK